MPQMLKDKASIIQWLDKHQIKNYVINQDLTVDVNNFVQLSEHNLTHLPIQFGQVKGVFDISSNKLTTLLGTPHTIKSNFKCHNNKLKTLEFGPKIVSGFYLCSDNHLININHAPKELLDFYCQNNKLTELSFCPNVKGNADFSFNKISKLKVEEVLIGQAFILMSNPLTQLSYKNIENINSSVIVLPKLFSLLPIDKLVSNNKDKEHVVFKTKELKEYLLIQKEAIDLEILLSSQTNSKKNKTKL